jgi:hypothetical protein
MVTNLFALFSLFLHIFDLSHGRKYGPKGVGFGLGAGALNMDDGAKFGNKRDPLE